MRVDFTVENCVPKRQTLIEKLDIACRAQAKFLKSKQAAAIIKHIKKQVRGTLADCMRPRRQHQQQRNLSLIHI